jgi:hypothetical protein
MLKKNSGLIVRFILLFGIFLGLTWVPNQTVQAATCTWEGDNGPDWAIAGNWSCGHVPTTGDDIVIPDVGVDPIIALNIDVNTISIDAGAVLTVNATQYSPTFWCSSTFVNNGEIVINGVNPGSNGLAINSPSFSNDGTVTINAGYISLIRGGTHTGSFVGGEGTALTFNNQWPSQIHTFSAGSIVSVPIILVNNNGNTIDFYGEFSPGLLSTESGYITIFSSSTVNLYTNNILMPAEVNVYGTLNVAATSPVDIPTLKVGPGGFLENSNTLNITSGFDLGAANLTGAGDINISNTASSVIVKGGSISGKTLSNNATANWNSGNMTLSSGAVFENQGTFNANAATTMTGTVTEEFINHGVLTKNTAGTTTTMNIPFTNNGTVEVIEGSLVFQQGLENGEDVILDLGGGTLNPGETLTIDSGDSLIGSGALSANLTNSGTVSPGSSPGTITVNGDYTQEASGTLDIELGGTTPDTEHDQLVVTGAATLGGTLNVTLINGFVPELGDTFTIMTYGSVSGAFASASLPALSPGLKWGVSLGETSMRLIVEADGGGSISGEVTYTGSHGYNPINVGLFEDPSSGPVHTIEVTSTTGTYPYSIVGIPNGTYYVGALMDLNGSHDPDPDEPFAWYSLTPGGAPTAIVISAGTPVYTNIDIQLDDPFAIFLPLFLH